MAEVPPRAARDRKSFGGLTVVTELDLHVDEGEIVSVIGPNGAGKTTLFNLITGIYTPDAGDILFEGKASSASSRTRSRSAASRARSRPAAVPEHDRQGERDGGRVRAHASRRSSARCCARRACAARSGRSRSSPRSGSAFFGQRLMGYRWNQPAYSLSYANRRRLEIARATATKPRLLLLDEPAAGMNPVETHEITELIGQAARRRRVHDPGDRARHARRRGHLRPRDRARPRREDRRGRVRAGGDEREGRRGVPRPRDGASEMSACPEPARARRGRHLLRADPHPAGAVDQDRAGRARLPARRQRVGQVDDAEDDPRHRPAAQRRGAHRRRGRDEASDELPHRPRPGDRPGEPPALRRR